MVSDFQVKDGQVPMILDLGSSWKPGRHQPAGLCGFVKGLCASQPFISSHLCGGRFWLVLRRPVPPEGSSHFTGLLPGCSLGLT